jgi:hypothetical protein
MVTLVVCRQQRVCPKWWIHLLLVIVICYVHVCDIALILDYGCLTMAIWPMWGAPSHIFTAVGTDADDERDDVMRHVCKHAQRDDGCSVGDACTLWQA